MKAHYLAYGLAALIILGMPFAAAMSGGAGQAISPPFTHGQKIEKFELSLHSVAQENKTLKSM